jgi:ribosomal protein S18 acetylase RimI-like enzyme
MSFETPYFFATDFEAWQKSFTDDIDGEGRTLFKELSAKAVYDNDELTGFVQYGKTAFGFDDNGEISNAVSYPVIRNLYFKEGRADVGKMLFDEAVSTFADNERVYSFFHYFGMSCFARHGKLFEKHNHIEALLTENGFELEHENVYYSSTLSGSEDSDATVEPHGLTKGSHQYIDFKLDGAQVGGCEVHYLDENTVYLRWIYVNGDITGKGIGTKCMTALKSFIYQKSFKRFDTDTALNNLVAQHYYEKNNFIREGITRSYYN